jgi:LPS export ABC transporter protein LptC
MKLLKNLIILLAVIFVGVYLKNTLFKEEEDIHVRSLSPNAEKEQVTEQVKSFSITGFSDSGKKAWEMEGKSANIFSDIIDLSDINANSYGDDVKVNLKADEGVFDRTSNNIELRKNVIIVTDEGTTLTTEVLNWDAAKELVHTDEHVFIQRKDMDIAGTGASAKPDLKIARLDKNISVNTKDPPALITCDGPLEIDYDKNVAYFNNNVKLIDSETTIDTDKATAYFQPKEKSLKKVVCKGNVMITRGKDVTYADLLTYLPGEGRVILEGRPKIVIRDTEGLLQKSNGKKNEQTKS